MAISNSEKLRKWRAANPEKVKEQKRRHKERHPDSAKLYREKTKDKAAETRLEWQRNNKEKVNLSCKQWRQKNPDKNRAKALRYYMKKMQRVVGCEEEFTHFVELEATHLCTLRETLTGIKWHVDHIVPLHHKQACGLHNAFNLQVVPGSWNISKGNRNMDTYFARH